MVTAGLSFPDPTGAINFLIKILNGLIGVLTFFFRIPLLGMGLLVVIGLFYLYARSKSRE